MRFSFGYAIDQPVREAILALPERAWAGRDADGEPREGAWVAELTGHVTLDAWPQGSRLICRRERPHPGAQLSFTDLDGHRFQCFITDQPDDDLAALEAATASTRSSRTASATLKAPACPTCPSPRSRPNGVARAALCAHDLTVWTQAAALRRRARHLRAQAAALPAAARRRAPHPPRPPAHAAPARRLALGRRDRARFKRLAALPAYR